MKDVVRTPSMLTYYFVNAFPTQLTALPVTYEGSTITKTTVTFNYDRYVILNHQGTGKAEFQQPEPTSSSATLPEWAQSQSQPSLLANPSFSWGSDSSIPFQPL
jgi:hypothetical protein